MTENILPILVVVGACGLQGGSVIDAILANCPLKFQLRGLTRNPASAAAQTLKARGVEIVFADLDDMESLNAAFTGASGAFCMTNFWEHLDANREFIQASNLAAAARHCNVPHVIWSTLEDTRILGQSDDLRSQLIPGNQDGFKIPHFDAKGQADKQFDPARTTYLRTSFYFDNLLNPAYGIFQPDGSGGFVVSLPLKVHTMPGIAVSDIGQCAKEILENPRSWVGKTVGIAGQFLSGQEIADTLISITGKPCCYQSIDCETYRALPFPGADELGRMYQLYCEYESELKANRQLSIETHQNLTFERFLQTQTDRIRHM